MPYDIIDKLVIGVASSALFDLKDSDRVFREEGEQSYRAFQREHEQDILPRGVAFPFMRRLLGLNNSFPDLHPIEVILFSRNDPDTGQRVFNSIKSYGLDITRGVFLSGSAPYTYLNAFQTALFLSANREDVIGAIECGCAAGMVLSSSVFEADEDQSELRVAFDFDGVIADDSAEVVYQKDMSLDAFQKSESEKALNPHNPGPLGEFFVKLSQLQQLERRRKDADPLYRKQIRTAIITARNAPAHQRVVTTLRAWNVMADETFFMGGIEKKRVLDIFRPHIFFDDQLTHLEPSAQFIPSVHIPFGQINRTVEET
ncbi:MAG: 5'-nucleotidase [Spirochaetales bacterium]|nr:5'-nucleotidase [Spirochaetales bacterium]